MNDALYEQLVSRRTKPLYYILLGGAFLLAVLIAVLGTMFFGVFSFIAGALIALIAYYFISPQLSVEYEYTILNHDLQIDAIYNKSRRKPKMTLDIQTAETLLQKIHTVWILTGRKRLMIFLRSLLRKDLCDHDLL